MKMFNCFPIVSSSFCHCIIVQSSFYCLHYGLQSLLHRHTIVPPSFHDRCTIVSTSWYIFRCFAMIENCQFQPTSELNSAENMDKMDSQEGMIGMGLTSTFHTILMQCSPQIFKVRQWIDFWNLTASPPPPNVCPLKYLSSLPPYRSPWSIFFSFAPTRFSRRK